MLGKAIKKIFGSKHEKDVKRLTPVVEEINKVFETLRELSDEELKGKTDLFRTTIRERIGAVQEEIRKLKDTLKAVTTEEKIDFEDVRLKIEALEKEEKEKTEEVLREILPEAFAVVKE
ncbi:MAG: preprotein translocase subunit SecA, partial [bacterium]